MFLRANVDMVCRANVTLVGLFGRERHFCSCYESSLLPRDCDPRTLRETSLWSIVKKGYGWKNQTECSVVPICPLAHSLIDGTITVGHCEHLSATPSADTHPSKHLKTIQRAAKIDDGGTQGLPMRVDCPTQTPRNGNRQHEQIAEKVENAH
jgi:hypothetical protein